ncbi:uncharacterized protein (DUF736 family) [Rhizobium sp. BK077]|nr:uncharacterized protein (DUF736 family) [Rhizobium sp. BK112]MBB3371386.1 uncharacterized protein (DUF736 family) [Rhizobium sp. BK077]MBB4182125.1 uncharacterized protein (DUF736 family) [Rhizobium sp. BK109]MBB4255555.1 uncharacterized protein (DUF736 family) [Rhizobium sp. BK008]
MATIGTFTTSEAGFNGSIRTLALNVKARIARVENPSDKGPHYRIYAGNVELGAAWQKRSPSRTATTCRSSSTTRASPPRSTQRSPKSRARTVTS